MFSKQYGTRVNWIRVAYHAAFWLVIGALFVFIYSFKTNWRIALHNNLFFMPVHMGLFYTIAYWLIPQYLIKGRYVVFTLLLIIVNIGFSLICRIVDTFIVYHYNISNYAGDYLWFLTDNRPALRKITDPVMIFNAFKSLNLVALLGIGIKFFKMWYERKQAAVQAELAALKGQLHPHFLFNTLNNVYSLTLQNSPKSSQAVLGLSEMLRYMLYECNADLVSLKKEVTMLQHYTELEKLRYGDRLDLTFTIRGNLDNRLISPLLLLPFVENIFKHGASEKLGQAWVNINLALEGNVLKLKASNSKPETPPVDAGKHHGNIGLKNVKQRLELLYPGKHQLKIMDDDEVFLVVLELTLTHKPGTALQPEQYETTHTYS